MFHRPLKAQKNGRHWSSLNEGKPSEDLDEVCEWPRVRWGGEGKSREYSGIVVTVIILGCYSLFYAAGG